jgi:lipopolysaccharide biosynthesis glycosyltransferase
VNAPSFRGHVLFCADQRACWGLAAAVSALLRCARPEVRWTVHVLDCGLASGFTRKLQRNLAAHFPHHLVLLHRVSAAHWAQLHKLEGSVATYGRLLAPELVAADRCLYLDCDTLPRQCPSVLLAGPFAAGNPVLAVRNQNAPTFGDAHPLTRLAAWGVPPATPYFNAGMLVLNLQAWRAERAAEACLELARREPLPYHDQDAINRHFLGRVGDLDPQWNRQTSGAVPDWNQTAIVHYVGRSKPWNAHYPDGLAQPFRDTLRTSGWKHWRPRLSLGQWLRATPFRPYLSQWQFRLRTWLGLPGLRPR